MKTEQEVRNMLNFLRALDGHPEGIKALEWVLGLYPPPPMHPDE